MDNRESSFAAPFGNDKDQVNRLLKEVKSLKQKIETLEEENHLLKKSIYELSARYSKSARQSADRPPSPYPLKFDPSEGQSGKGGAAKPDQAGPATRAGSPSAIVSSTASKSGTSGTLATGHEVAHEAHRPVAASAMEPTGEMMGLATRPTRDVSMKGAAPVSIGAVPSPSGSSTAEPLPSDTVQAPSGKPATDWSAKQPPWSNRPFTSQVELKGHTGAVFTVRYAGDGQRLASGGFDGTVRLWDLAGEEDRSGYEPGTGAVLTKHSQTVACVAWSQDDCRLFTGSYDQSARVIDIATGQTVHTITDEGCVLCVAPGLSRDGGQHLWFAGTSHNQLVVADSRQRAPVCWLSHPGMVNCLDVDPSSAGATAPRVWTGDSQGRLRLWDLRWTPTACTYESEVAPGGTALSSLARTRPTEATDETYLAVNAYDDVLRIYRCSPASDRRSPTDTSETATTATSSPRFPEGDAPRLLQRVQGYRNRHWPIGNAASLQTKPRVAQDLLLNTDLAYDTPTVTPLDEPAHLPGSDAMLLVATGSAEPFAYVYTVDPVTRATGVQRLEGHTERVYAVDFHPHQPSLCTCSSDSTIRLWSTVDG